MVMCKMVKSYEPRTKEVIHHLLPPQHESNPLADLLVPHSSLLDWFALIGKARPKNLQESSDGGTHTSITPLECKMVIKRFDPTTSTVPVKVVHLLFQPHHEGNDVLVMLLGLHIDWGFLQSLSRDSNPQPSEPQ